jgi:rod shape-determining protein MreD
MSPPIVFALGLLADLLGLTPPGISVLVLMVVHGMAVRWRVLAGQGFLLVWLAFIAVAALAALLGWLLTSALTLHVLPFQASLFAFALSAGLYPALAFLFTIAHRGLADPGQA